MKKNLFMLTLAMFTMMVIATSCSSDNDDNGEITLSDQTMYAGDSVKIATNATTTNQFVAYVSKKGYLHAYHVGETTLSYNGQTVKVNVHGHYNAFNILTDWNLTSEQVKAQQKEGIFVKEDTSNGVHYITYQNDGTANRVVYAFKEDKLMMAMVMSNPSDEKEIINYLMERYIFIPEEVDAYTWAGVDALTKSNATTFVMETLDTSYQSDYMLQTTFISFASLQSNSKVNLIAAKAFIMAGK